MKSPVGKITQLALIPPAVIAILFAALPLSADDIAGNDISGYSLEDLMNVKVITAARTYTTTGEAPAAVYVITEKHIRERGYKTLVEALYDVPGFDFQNTYGIWPDLFHQRGLVGNNQRSLMYINGTLANNISESGIRGGGSRYPLFNVKQVEIVSGPASALYGANAFNGVINIITKEGADSPGYLVQATGGAWETRDDRYGAEYSGRSVSLAARGVIEGQAHCSYSVSAYYFQAGGPDFRGVRGLDAGYNGYFWSDYYNNSHEDSHNITAAVTVDKIRFNFSSSQYLMGQGTFANGHYEIDTDKRGFAGSNWDFSDKLVSIAYLYDSGGDLKVESELSFRHTSLLSSSHEQYPIDDGKDLTPPLTTPDIYNHPELVYTVSDYSRPDYAYSIKEQAEWTPNRQLNAIVGGEAIYYSVPAGYGEYRRYRYQNYATYAQAIYRPIEDVSLTGGYRYDYHTDYGSSHTPRFSIVGTPGDLVLKALVSGGFRAPTAWELYNETNQRRSNTDLTPEKMISGEAGLGYRFLGRYLIYCNGYYNRITNLILEVKTNEPNPSTGDNWNQNQNVGNADIAGAEVSADFQVTERLNFFANYTYSIGWYDDIPGSIVSSPATAEGDEIPNIARHKANAGITVYVLRNLSAHARVNFVGPRNTIAGNPEGEIDGYALVHCNLRWENFPFQGFYLQLLARNVLDTRAWDPGVRTATGAYYPTRHPLEGRNIWLTAGYKF
ncbi:MAG: TonB-dependent receptor [Spirochaetes bacterium]|nr:TonB-dependent receptor [Spirochaetota bacterium]